MTVTFGKLYRTIAVLLCVLMVAPAFPQTSSSQAAGQITALVPQATRNGAIASVKEDVMWNDLMRTEPGGRARITLKDGSMLSLGSNTELRVVEHDTMTQQTQIELNYGRVRSNVRKLTQPGGKFEIKTPTATAGVVGTDFVVAYEGGHMQVIVFSGVVKVIGAGGLVLGTVGAGQMVEVTNGVLAPVHPVTPGIQQDNIAQTSAGHAGATSTAGAAATHSFLHTILIAVGAAAGVGIVAGGVGKGNGDLGGQNSPLPCPDSARRGRSAACKP